MCLWYALCQLYKNKIQTIITAVMITLSFIVITYSGITYLQFRGNEWKAREVVEGDFKNIYHINLINYFAAGGNELYLLNELYQWMQNQSELKWYGLYYYYDEEKILYVSGQILKMCGIEVEKEEEKSAWVGCNRQADIPVGSEFEDAGIEFEVVSCLDKNSRFIGHAYTTGLAALISLDDYVIVDLDVMIQENPAEIGNGIVNNLYYEVETDRDADFFEKKLRDKADELGLDIYGINNLKSLFKANARDAMEKAGEKYLMPLVLALCACVALCVCSMQSYHINRHDSSVMLSCGMTRRDISGIYMCENLIKILSGYSLSLMYWVRKNREMKLETFIISSYYSWLEYLKYMILICFGLCFVFTALCSMPVIIKIRKNKFILYRE
ncbi:MAG: hypothetical protein K2G45_08995 [Lachnospiraceae bacterium]|nr:hypothetical protein [Lachnospiraceae bacterium]